MDKLLLLLKQINLPYACDSFAEGEAPETPYMIYLTPGINALYADGINFFSFLDITLEVYLDKKTPDIEKQVESVLKDSRIAYEKEENFIDTEKLYEVVYTFELEDDNNE